MGIVVGGERSGVGKTTITLALLAYLSQQQQRVQSFKVGPDYIDPMFHRHVTQRPCRNLDPVLTSEAYVQQCFARHTQDASHAIVEGVMGLFDGAADRPTYASTAHLARLLNLPILLVLDCSRLSHSIAALVHGYRSFDPRLQFAGLVLNRVGSDRHLELLKSALEPLQIPILGVLRRHDGIQIPDRHLGLVPTAELPNLREVIDQLAQLGATCFDWEQLMPLLETQPIQPHKTREGLNPPTLKIQPRIAIAQDSAFNFYYADNLDLLADLGAELIPWSPLQDSRLPENIQGLYLGGGFPEMFAEQLADNRSVRQSVQKAIQAGMPTYAECGGLMYLCQSLTTFTGDRYPMVGSLPTSAVMGARLTLGYRQVMTLQDSPLMTQGQRVWGHEFHRSHLTELPDQPLFQFSDSSQCRPGQAKQEGWRVHQVHASYVHLHWGSCPELPIRFLQTCQQFPGWFDRVEQPLS